MWTLLIVVNKVCGKLLWEKLCNYFVTVISQGHFKTFTVKLLGLLQLKKHNNV